MSGDTTAEGRIEVTRADLRTVAGYLMQAIAWVAVGRTDTNHPSRSPDGSGLVTTEEIEQARVGIRRDLSRPTWQQLAHGRISSAMRHYVATAAVYQSDPDLLGDSHQVLSSSRSRSRNGPSRGGRAERIEDWTDTNTRNPVAGVEMSTRDRRRR